MRSKVPFGDVEARPSKLHDIIAFYRDSAQLQSKVDEVRSHTSGGYDYQTYEDIKPESMDNPPIQHLDSAPYRGSREPNVYRPNSAVSEPVEPAEKVSDTSSSAAPAQPAESVPVSTQPSTAE